jgi:HEAT repeat protein
VKTRALVVTARRAFALGALALLCAVVVAPGTAGGASRSGAGPGDPPVVELLIELLATGTTPDRAVAALGALTKLADPRSVEAVELYAGHRRMEVRREAVRALGAINDQRAIPVLLDRLGDDAPEVRAAAAESLVLRKEARALPRLIRLLRRGDAGAAVPLGQLATPETVAQLGEIQGAVADGLLATALGAYVKRADAGDSVRIEALRVLAKLHGAEATTELVEYLASIPARDNRPSKREAQRLLDQRSVDR